MNTLTSPEEQEARKFIAAVSPYVILKFDFDGVIVDSEKVAANQTKRLINEHLDTVFQYDHDKEKYFNPIPMDMPSVRDKLTNLGFKEQQISDMIDAVCDASQHHAPLSLQFIGSHLSGLSFDKQQVPAIEAIYGVAFPEDLKEKKKAGNFAALSQETEAIPGIIGFFHFIKEHGLNAIGVTQSDAARVKGTLTAEGCKEVAQYLTTSLEEGLHPQSGKIPFLSAGARIEWNGQVIETLPSKPDPAGYNLAYEIARSKTPLLLPKKIIFEDSETGAKAAVAAGADKVGIVPLGGHCCDDPNHIPKMTNIVGQEKAVLIANSSGSQNNPWIPGAMAALELGLKGAREAGLDLPMEIPNVVVDHVIAHLNRHYSDGYTAKATPQRAAVRAQPSRSNADAYAYGG